MFRITILYLDNQIKNPLPLSPSPPPPLPPLSPNCQLSTVNCQLSTVEPLSSIDTSSPISATPTKISKVFLIGGLQFPERCVYIRE
ncbi:hypothetical protein [Microcoleus sp. CAWBG58]|uniref:hypothetical protein n=1 Tax=Microcoleus sp. CAWBG58 TaxID=2841651 RepID=UPI0025FB0ABD|nr:hypothetical protein [Microcoleus sp. CAWBG58]